ncbi:MAG TPA: hypothetical protein VGX76_13280 [Pirellulales bacterium]|nr:hypothetical protein [Pirellulales bacterium]
MKEPSRPTDDELEDRIERTRCLLAAGNRKADVKKALIAAYGVCARTCENYIARAREKILEGTGKPKDEHRAEALAFYETLKTSPESPVVAKIKAQERIDKLLGLEAPQKLEHAGADGQPLTFAALLLASQAPPAEETATAPSEPMPEPLDIAKDDGKSADGLTWADHLKSEKP